MRGDPEFVILKYSAWLDASKFETAILGAIVRYPLRPSYEYVPDNPLRYNNEELVEGTFTDFLFTGSNTSSKEATGALGSVAGVSWKATTKDSTNLAGKLVRYKRLQQHGRFWERLRADPAIQATVPGWISLLNTWPPCLVVGIMTAEDVELDYSGKTERNVSGNAELPLATVALAAAGIVAPDLALDGTNIGSPSAAAASNHQVATVFKAKSGQSKIFALELRVVTTKLLRRRDLALNEGGPKVDVGRLAGDGEISDDEQEELPKATDLIIDDFTEFEYGQMMA